MHAPPQSFEELVVELGGDIRAPARRSSDASRLTSEIFSMPFASSSRSTWRQIFAAASSAS